MSIINRRESLSRIAGLSMASQLVQAQQQKPRNVIFILTDDHRYDAMGFLKGQSFLQTPHMDRLAREGAYFKNAFVTTALCSPSRASILTGTYAHRHRVVDNNTAIPKGTEFFPKQLQQAGYKTGFFGKWHMGNSGDAPQPGFDQWVSFLGQGSYLPVPSGLNVNGSKVPQKGYITDELTDYAVEWLRNLNRDQPYFMYLSHKATHHQFTPAARHAGKYKNEKFVPPATMAATGPMAQHRPMWVQNQRNSWHGVEYPYHSTLDIGEYYKQYAETLCGVDDSIGRVLGELDRRGQLDSTLVIYMGDNGFAFGEHGLIDKRTAYEESMRVPLVARCPELFTGGKTVNQMVANLDIMPTVLDVCGAPNPGNLDGKSWLPLMNGAPAAGWRQELLYEYYWERNYPQTPTIHALRTDKYKFIRCHGVWDLDELYDLEADPLESKNLIFAPEHRQRIAEMRARLFQILEQTNGQNMPLWPDSGGRSDLRNRDGPKPAEFPRELIRPMPQQ